MNSALRMVLPVTAMLVILNRDGSPETINAGYLPPPGINSVHSYQLPPETRHFIPPPPSGDTRMQRASERSANIEWLKEKTKKYSPDSWYLLMSYDSLPEVSAAPLTGGGTVTTEKSTGTFGYLRGRSRIDMLVSMETNVHEIAHAYFDKNVFRYLNTNSITFNPDNSNGIIYITPDLDFFISFPLKSLFPSAKLAPEIPSRLRTYRYDTYISGTTSTQSEGVIGLLNELHAYYIGSRFCYDMFEPYREAAGSETSGLFEWVTHSQSTMSAFYEFDFFISEYLLFMKRNHSGDYLKLCSDPSFTESYSLLRKLYTDLIDRYMGRILSETARLNRDGGSEIRVEDGWLWVKAEGSHISGGTPLFSEEREILLPVLESRRYREIREDF